MKRNLPTKNIVAIFVATFVIFSWGMGAFPANVSASNTHATIEHEPTIRMGDNTPMTREEFSAWSGQHGIRHINIEGRIYPIIVFFRGNNGQAFAYEELKGYILYVSLIPREISTPRKIHIQDDSIVSEQNLQNNSVMPVLFYDRKPVHLSYEELTAIMEAAPPCPMYTRSAITLPRRRLTETELAAWIVEYNEMGGASALELAVVREINRVRAEYGLHPLALDPTLMMSARLKTQEFGDLQYFSHQSPIHGSPMEASRLFGFGGLVGETISRTGSNTAPVAPCPERVVGGMLASTRGHRDILLNPTAYSVGFGTFFSPNSTGAAGNLTHSFYVATKFGFVHE